MKNFTSSSLFLLLALAFVGLTITSCGDEEITGCTDESAENYDALATISGDCTFAADKFIGSYVGMSDCSGGPVVASLTNDTLMFEIKSALDPDNSNAVVIEIPIMGVPVSFGSIAEGNVMTVNETLGPLPFDVPNPADPTTTISVMVNIAATGEETYDDATDSVSGTISIMITSADSGATLDNGSCLITGVKQ